MLWPAYSHESEIISWMAEDRDDRACAGMAGIWCITRISFYDYDALGVARDGRARLRHFG